MFEITDDFLVQAGFTSLSTEESQRMKDQVSQSVQAKIGEYIAKQLGDESLAELIELMDGDFDRASEYLEKVDPGFRESESFRTALDASGKAGATEEEFTNQYAVLTWMKQSNVPVAEVVQQSMNDAMVELRMIYQQVATTMNEKSGE